MPTLHGIWADDSWSGGEDAGFLASCRDTLSRALDAADCYVEWTCYNLASGAAIEIANRGHDWRLAIVDLRFGTERWDWRVVVDALGKRNIPYVVFTNFAADAHLEERLENDPLRLATISKDTEGLEKLVDRIIAFFQAPPIRLLHLSDLHVSAGDAGDDAAEQDARYRALVDCVEAEARVRPFDAVALTGDFAAHDPPRDLVAAREKVRMLINRAVPSLDRVFVIPGNHDVHWADFSSRTISDQPWQPYLDFYQACFGLHPDLVAEVGAWDADQGLMRSRAVVAELMWARSLPALRLNVVGLATPTVTPTHQGLGEFTPATEAFLREHWRGEPVLGEVRLALMHHNIFSVLSASAHDEQHTLLNSGGALRALMSAQCGLVLSGHTHTATVMQCHAGRLGTSEWHNQGTLTAVSAGTTGGLHRGLDRPRAFNIVELGDARPQVGRSLSVRTFLYDAGNHRWNEVRDAFTL